MSSLWPKSIQGPQKKLRGQTAIPAAVYVRHSSGKQKKSLAAAAESTRRQAGTYHFTSRPRHQPRPVACAQSAVRPKAIFPNLPTSAARPAFAAPPNPLNTAGPTMADVGSAYV